MFGGQVIKHNNHHDIINPIFIIKPMQSRKLKVHEKDIKKSGKVRSLELHLCTNMMHGKIGELLLTLW